MRILVYEWSSYLQRDIYDMLKWNGVCYELFRWNFVNKNEDDEFIVWFTKNYNLHDYDALMSINYWPLLSEMCEKYGKKYVAWCYDNPLNVMNIEDTLENKCNYVFLYDRIQYETYRAKGYETVYHLPLGINGDRLKKIELTPSDRNKYGAQVAFVGSLYESRLAEILNPLNDYTKGMLHAAMDAQDLIYGWYLLEEAVTTKLMDDINAQYKKICPETQFVLSREALIFAMASEITRRNRLVLLSLCGERYDTRLYSSQDSTMLAKVKKSGRVDYVDEMPKVFACTKINLNPSLRCIQSGIPLRAFDIMGAGGFLLSNYQHELVELFEHEKEMVVYESIEDAIAKIDFYLKHEEIRQNIEKAGRKKVLEEHTLQIRMENIFQIADLI